MLEEQKVISITLHVLLAVAIVILFFITIGCYRFLFRNTKLSIAFKTDIKFGKEIKNLSIRMNKDTPKK